MRARFDPLTVLLVGLGAILLAASLVGVLVLLRPAPQAAEPKSEATHQSTVAADRMATVLRLDPTAGAVSAAQVGDHVDVLAYFSRQVTGVENITRLLVADVPVLAVARDGAGAGLTLAVPQSTALLLHEAQALGARPFVVLRATGSGLAYPPSLSDTDLAERLAAPRRGQVTSGGN
jgi:hypothetical protein